MAIYPAFLIPEGEGRFGVEFPDLPGCATQGEGEQDAMAKAMDALIGHIEALRDLGREVPPPSSPLALTPPEGAVIILVQGPPEAAPPVRISVSIDKNLLKEVDASARNEGLTRSGFLAAAAKNYMGLLREAQK